MVTKSLAPTVWWWFARPATHLLASMCCLSFVIVGRYGVNQQILLSLDLNNIMTGSLLVIALCHLIAGYGYLHVQDKYPNAVECFVGIPGVVVIAIGVYFEAQLLRAGWIAVILDLFLQFYLMALVYGPSHGGDLWPLFSMAVFVALAALQVLQWRTKWLCMREVKHTLSAYERVWKALRRSDSVNREMDALSRSVDILALSHVTVVRQVQRKHTYDLTDVFTVDRSRAIMQTLNPVFKDIRFFPIPKTMKASARITSLDQLYAQASICSIVLAKMARRWAQESDGYLAKVTIAKQANGRVSFSNGGARYVRPSEEDEGSYLEYAARAIKSRKRAMIKFMMCYGGDPSRLVDLARNRIAFDSIADLHKCFLSICNNPDVVIERVKNRLTPTYNSAKTGGYRDLCINLRIVDSSILEMGAETHICELQLALTCFTNLESPDSHRKFTNWRRYSSSVLF